MNKPCKNRGYFISIPSNYNVEETSTIPYFNNNLNYKGIFSYFGV
jgi:hypothetical protein